MTVVVVGGGGREHAIVWKLRQDDPALDIVAAPGNPGVATLARCATVSPTDIAGIVDLARAEAAELVVVGPEAPLAAGLVDRLRAQGIRAFGPTRAAAQIEASKRFCKELLLSAGVPTARATWHTAAASAKQAVRRLGAPVVIKASGLAAGKGVFVCDTVGDADKAIDLMLQSGALGSAGAEVLVEEHMAGEEVSLFALTDGESFVPMLPAQDHKRLGEGDTGPNTGGMGAYAPLSIAPPEVVARVGREVIEPTLAAMRESGAPFTGLLYAGLMLTAEGPKVVEFNCRFGDPETQVVLPMLHSPLLEHLLAASIPNGLRSVRALEWREGAAVTTVVASEGYPDAPVVGRQVTFGEEVSGTVLFHAGTQKGVDGAVRTAGGRVFAATGLGSNFHEAAERSRRAAAAVIFEGAIFRRDIGWREAARRARAT